MKTSVEHVTCDDYHQADKKAKIEEFNQRLDESLDEANFIIEGQEGKFESMYLDDVKDDKNPGVVHVDDGNTPSPEDYGDMHTEDRPEDDNQEAIDKYLNVELIMNMGTNDEQCGHVIKRSWGLVGEAISQAHANPLFDTREYEVEFMDGTHERYQANIIAENMFAQVDNEGNQYLLLQEITDHKKDNSAIPISEGTIQNSSGMLKPKVTTRGWFLLVQQHDGLTSWEKLADLKASNPVEFAEYAVVNRLAKEPAFKWWVPHIIKRIELFPNRSYDIGEQPTSSESIYQKQCRKH